MLVRKASFASAWYPDDKNQLNSIFEKELKELDVTISKETKIAILPHAGLFYSSRGLAHLLKNRNSLVKEVLIISPSHYYPLRENEILFSPFESYETPLGNLKALKNDFSDKREQIKRAFESEHAIEMILLAVAYLQNRQNEAIKITTALLNSITDEASLKAIAAQINEVIEVKKETLIIASSDFTHYGRNFSYTPFGKNVDKNVLEEVKNSDLNVGSLLKESNYEKLIEAMKKRSYTICGLSGSTVASYIANQNNLSGTISDYYTSVDVSKSISNDFVAYLSLLWG